MPLAAIHPQTPLSPPPCLTMGMRCCFSYTVSCFLHTSLHLFIPKSQNLLSSVKGNFYQNSRDLLTFLFVKCRRFCLLMTDVRVAFYLLHAKDFSPTNIRYRIFMHWISKSLLNLICNLRSNYYSFWWNKLFALCRWVLHSLLNFEIIFSPSELIYIFFLIHLIFQSLFFKSK